jgi:hypothetical protein
MTEAEREELSRRLAETNKQSTSQSGKNGFDPMGGGQL